MRSPASPNIAAAGLGARLASGGGRRLAPNAKALIGALPRPPDRSIRSPLPSTAPGVKLNGPAPPPTVLWAPAVVLPLNAVVPAAPILISMPPAAPSILVVPLL